MASAVRLQNWQKVSHKMIKIGISTTDLQSENLRKKQFKNSEIKPKNAL